MQIDFSKRIFGLDLMRAIAILLVVFSHALWISPQASGFIPDLLKLFGVMGVEIFFVLSGFLIGRIVFNIYTDKNFNIHEVVYFWVRRWFRTLPNYYLVLILNVLLAFLLGFSTPDNLWRYFIFFQNFAWEMPAFFNESWSLPIEEFAYIIGPLILYVLFYFNRNHNRKKIFFWVTIVVILFFIGTKVFYSSSNAFGDMQYWNSNLKAVTLYRIDSIYFGVLAAFFFLVYPNVWHRLRTVSFYTGLIILFIIHVTLPNKGVLIENYPFYYNVVYLTLNTVAIALCLPVLNQIKSAPKPFLIPITYLSLISYSMYLLHYSVILQVLKYFIPTNNLSSTYIYLYATFYIVLTIVLAYVLYRIFEKPMMDLRDRPVFKRNLKSN